MLEQSYAIRKIQYINCSVVFLMWGLSSFSMGRAAYEANHSDDLNDSVVSFLLLAANLVFLALSPVTVNRAANAAVDSVNTLAGTDIQFNRYESILLNRISSSAHDREQITVKIRYWADLVIKICFLALSGFCAYKFEDSDTSVGSKVGIVAASCTLFLITAQTSALQMNAAFATVEEITSSLARSGFFNILQNRLRWTCGLDNSETGGQDYQPLAGGDDKLAHAPVKQM